MLGPGVNIYRAPLNGRNFEYFGEDPFLTSSIAVGYIKGMQSQGVSAAIKHFLANNSEYLRHNSDSVVDERTLREIYLPSFEAAVKQAHVGAIMDSYNLINREHATQNGYFNTEIVRKEWGFDGVMMSDWVATYDGVAAANGGLDLEMPTGAFMNCRNLLPAIADGRLKQATIDEKVRRILQTAARFGWLDRPQSDLSLSTYNEQNHQLALQAARESMVVPAESPAMASSGRPALYTLTFDVTNTGSRAGSEVAQVYVGEAKPSVPRPAKELKGFSRVELAAGETKHVTISLDARAFAFYDVAGKHWQADAGNFSILSWRLVR